jgi:hypothetical protein
MLKVTLAERILEAVTTRSGAASIVGDLLEENFNRTTMGFWFGVLRVFLSHVCCDLRAHWLRMIWLGFSEFFGSLFVLLIPELLFLLLMRGHLMPVLQIFNYSFFILIGWHVAKRSHGCELASSVAFIGAGCVFMGMILLTSIPRKSLSTIIFKTLYSALDSAPVVVGAFLFCYRANRRSRELPASKNALSHEKAV